MSNAHVDFHPDFHEFFESLPTPSEADFYEVAPDGNPDPDSKYTEAEWSVTMSPYIGSLLWLVRHHALYGAEATRKAYMKLSGDRQALIEVGYFIIFADKDRFNPGYRYTRKHMFVNLNLNAREFPVCTLKNMRVGTYRRLVEMAGWQHE